MTVQQTLDLGLKAPDFSLPGVDGNTYTLDSFHNKAVLIVIFSCNHCPYVQAYEPRIKAIQGDYAMAGVQVVAINANETEHHPEDSFEQMEIRARQMHFNFPYLRDETQTVATAYGATHTPQIFLFDRERTLRYVGRIDDNWKDPLQVQQEDLRRAIDEVLSGRAVSQPRTHAVGCTLKWRPD